MYEYMFYIVSIFLIITLLWNRINVKEGFDDKESSKVEWPELVIVLPSEANLPELDFRFTPRLMVAPASITDTNGFGVPWWEKSNNVSSLELFIQGLL